MKNKNWTSDETWLPKGPGQRILSSTPQVQRGTIDKDKRKKKGAQRTTSGSLYSVVLLVNKRV